MTQQPPEHSPDQRTVPPHEGGKRPVVAAADVVREEFRVGQHLATQVLDDPAHRHGFPFRPLSYYYRQGPDLIREFAWRPVACESLRHGLPGQPHNRVLASPTRARYCGGRQQEETSYATLQAAPVTPILAAADAAAGEVLP